MIDENKLTQIKQMIASAEEAIHSAKQMLSDAAGADFFEEGGDVTVKAKTVGKVAEGGRIIEGIFDGLNMIGPDGKQYNIPANYASKSKLVEGDVLKLTISDDGSFVYKQIGPVERRRLIGSLVQDEQTGEYRVVASGKSYKVLLASITYFKGETGDEVVILIPKDKQSNWAAVENIVKGGGTIENRTESVVIEELDQKEDNPEGKEESEKEKDQEEKIEDLEI
ncbi:MAG: hypothetical protein COT24_00645 [Candidatus Kerfeldbacteria bacterium CG08_land_8_20_14_0_20_40_16]|uniref:50S ribosomal protein L7/L12 n=1 Tax=Candidatus Kerfeldbacteria bacterium CG08_land_8_20_14_0_20_40_16 TaxID=2014244 RepID=A0A2H0YX22_9BACT|nr:MAG: hypothetical protein COT24_00645 [Candidatus Kerfeldbacteria bacterium CG08_land_8_20_14_0_20_40_16]